mmetsp:Transcript_46059/g.120653  ORF Transcript_46059/g.120653 Transcript_46059/m.120653 type:complete len:450 (-) Transcript_46059:266-1615(-)
MKAHQRDVQLVTDRYVPASMAGAPSSWGRLAQPVKKAIHVGPDTTWMLSISLLSCCTMSSNLTSCASLRSGQYNMSTIASAAGSSANVTGVLASPAGLEFAVCNGCQCKWSIAVASFGAVHDLQVGPAGRAYVAADTGLYSATMEGVVTAVSGLRLGTPYYAVAVAADQAINRICLAAASGDAIWMRRGGSSSHCDGPWRYEWTRGFLGAGSTPDIGAVPTSLTFAPNSEGSHSSILWVGEAAALHAIDGFSGAITRVQGVEGLPQNRILALSGSADGLLWIATRAGAVLRIGMPSSAGVGKEGAEMEGSEEADWRFLSGPRWLGTLTPNTPVQFVDSFSSSALLTTSEGGVARITIDPNVTVHMKARLIQAEWPRHMSNGLNARVDLTKFGESSSATAYPVRTHRNYAVYFPRAHHSPTSQLRLKFPFSGRQSRPLDRLALDRIIDAL